MSTRPRLYIFVGYPGAGKTTIARYLAKKTGAMHIWTDRERHVMFGTPTHNKRENTKLYGYLNELTGQLLKEGKSVIFDTNFNLRADRDKLRSIADEAKAETVLIWVETPQPLAEQRALSDKNLRNGYTAPMSADEFERIASHLEPPTDTEQPIGIDATKLDRKELDRKLGLVTS